jgi:LysR family nitrogen assimilation transcriptional regulator
VSAILDLVADGAGCAVLSRNAVVNSNHPTAYTMRTIESPALRSKVSIATSAVRPATRTQQSTLALIRQTVQAVMGESG